MNKFVSKSENDTIEFANNLASLLKNGDIIVLSGDLGSGKTKFTQGILKHFGLEDEISSPTFTIVNEYHKDETNIYHFDVYRLTDSDEFYAIGGDEYLNNGICIIEWGEIIEDILPNDYIKINFTKDVENENYRTLELIGTGENSQNILNKLN
ncbi:MAG: tRNA (adenosine(37)-N6)-threonylcarbamoyltransferase complex ATPase subunit type 1 TsaE [Clostridia bacterium]|nr:tRNA (adenosine(37)-N6)-threonylcarbamoyltransferase complex ATPase subunit type 1 TsaE [Clostridia bacterium]